VRVATLNHFMLSSLTMGSHTVKVSPLVHFAVQGPVIVDDLQVACVRIRSEE
jgi:hypothetical protein